MKIKELYKDSRYWCQGRYVQPIIEDDKIEYAHCFSNAICVCYEPNDRNDIRNRVQNEVGDIIPWNDDSRTTFKDVQNLCEKLDI
jgi:hypothetical protein